MQSSPEAPATGDFLCLLFFTVSDTCYNHTCIIQLVSGNWEMFLMSCELLNNADFYFCYVIKMLITLNSRWEQKCSTHFSTRLAPTINLSPATSFFWENHVYDRGIGGWVGGSTVCKTCSWNFVNKYIPNHQNLTNKQTNNNKECLQILPNHE